ncbi:iron(III) transport system substrate-binding protein [Paraburkholderia sp. BL6665CI2N2]|uniref:extracellular solute-binding protein n=1 Tax=Paraburkholderia sp. BL6665CI2N2 TaxID=1938806 RepID=UPI0010658E0C|nr:extracellular solute-binding protein [Paraburkholderia sp. BL6665CI2N2]TDY16824.1 iron(III) transport system substrate-binding protein [Paraburkholderia sp. BL6665CI2N2]
MSKFAAFKRTVASALMMLAAGAPAWAKDRVVVYTGINEERLTSAIKQEFTRQTGIDVDMLIIPANGTMVARVETEKNRPRADVIMDTTVDFMQKLKSEGLIEPYKAKAETLQFVQRGYADNAGYMHGWFAIVPTIFWNKEQFASDSSLKGVQPPSSWQGLLNPAFKGKVIVPNPQTTAMGAVMYITQIFRLGEANAWDYTRKLNNNIAQYTASASLPVTLVERGEGTIGVGWSADVLAATIGRGQKLGFAIPQDNAVSVWVAGIVKGGPNPDAARKFIDFLQSDYVQQAAPMLGYRLPVSSSVPPLEGMPSLSSIKTVKYDLDWAAQNMDRIRKQWAKETNN